MDWTATSSTLSGGSRWLSATPASGASGATAQAVSLSVSVNPTGLDAGEYYGQVAVAAPSAGNSPRLVSVVLNVLPVDKSPGAQVYPSGLLFTGVAHGANPDPKTVTLTNVAAAAAAYTSSNLTDDGASWITLTPALGSVPGSTSSNLAVQPNIASLGPGVWQGSITLRFGDGSVRIVNVALVLRSAPLAGSPKEHLAGGCIPTKLVPLFTSLGSSFSVPASWPSALEMAVVNDCGDPFTAGSVVSTFSNGDPPLPLTALREGNWGGTWTPRAVSASGVILTGQSRSPGGDLQGAVHITGGVLSNTSPPVISPGGIVSSASFATDAPLAPGSIIAIFGSHLADGAIAAQALPLPSQLGATQVIIGGESMPLFFVSDAQINAMLPYGIAVNRPYQVIVQRGTSSTIPESITLAAAGPAVFTKDQTGIGPGLVFDAQFRSNDTTNPAAAGDAVVIYTTGLGDVNPAIPAGAPAPLDALSPTASPATVTIGGVAAPQVLFAGLAPGFTGLYQVNVVVPAGVTPGDAVPIIITVADRPGPPVTLAVR
jgi:adhesin/invasin